VLAAPAFAAVHVGDKLQVQVFNHPELSVQATVDARGRIQLPVAGTIDVAGLETEQIASRIETALRPFVRKPAVAVQGAGENPSLFVSGGPGGVLAYRPGETLAGALADVQKIDGIDIRVSRVDLKKISVERDGHVLGTYDATWLSAKGESGPALLPGDTLVFVNKPIAVRVQGEVKEPGLAYLAQDEPISDAISQAGGLLQTAATAPVTLVRGGSSRALALGDPAFREPAQSGDVITVPVAPRVTVAGAVTKPGPAVLASSPTLLSAIATAGGPDKAGDLRGVQVLHQGAKAKYDVTAVLHGDFAQNPALSDGDVVIVPETRKWDGSQLWAALGAFSSLSGWAWFFSHH
jgi:polysaccharide export outer membrane protein